MLIEPKQIFGSKKPMSYLQKSVANGVAASYSQNGIVSAPSEMSPTLFDEKYSELLRY